VILSPELGNKFMENMSGGEAGSQEPSSPFTSFSWIRGRREERERRTGNLLTIFFPFLNQYAPYVFIREFPLGSERKRPRIISKSEFIRNRIHKSETSHSTCSD
jgi:hypothetical protein